jgi:hypothetical protein
MGLTGSNLSARCEVFYELIDCITSVCFHGVKKPSIFGDLGGLIFFDLGGEKFI